MAAATTFLRNLLADFLTGRDTLTAPANFHLALLTSAPGDGGSGGTEAAGGDYGRLTLANDDSSWDRDGLIVSNLGLLLFPEATAGWGTITHWKLFDDATAGNAWFYGAFTPSATVGTGARFRLGIGKLAFTFDAKSNYLAAEILDHIFGLDTFVPPATLYQSLYTSNPTNAGGGTEVSTGGTGYGRHAFDNDVVGWDRTDNVAGNAEDHDFDEAEANWGSVSGTALQDASSGGNLYGWAPLVSPQVINTGSQLSFLASQLRIRVR